MRTTIRKSGAVLAVGVSLLAACQASIPNQVLTKKPAPVSAPTPVTRPAEAWGYHPSSQQQSVVVDQRAVLTIRTDTITRTDTLASHAEVGFAVALAGSVNGSVSAFAVRANGQSAVPSGLAIPFPFRGDFSARGMQLKFFSPSEAAPCASNPLSVVQSLRDLWFLAPDTLRVGAAWSDSSTYVICRDGIPLRISTHRAFRVTGAAEHEGRMLLTITRTATTSLEGNGAQFGESITLAGNGTGELVYELDPSAGEIFSATGTALLDFSLRSHLRTQVVHQTAEIRIGRR